MLSESGDAGAEAGLAAAPSGNPLAPLPGEFVSLTGKGAEAFVERN